MNLVASVAIAAGAAWVFHWARGNPARDRARFPQPLTAADHEEHERVEAERELERREREWRARREQGGSSNRSAYTKPGISR